MWRKLKSLHLKLKAFIDTETFKSISKKKKNFHKDNLIK